MVLSTQTALVSGKGSGMERTCSSFSSPWQPWGLGMGVEKEPSLGPICTSNVSASETHLVKGLGVIFMRQVRLERINTETRLRTLNPKV